MQNNYDGKFLIDLGYNPSKWFAQVLQYLNDNPGLSEDEIRKYIDSVRVKEIDIFSEPVKYFRNIDASNDLEAENIISVEKTMDVIMRTPTVVSGAIMPDACPAGEIGTIPVGGVVVARNAIHPGMHSADICCSVMMTNLGNTDPKSVMDIATKTTHFGSGGRNTDERFVLPAELEIKIKQNYFLNSQSSIEKAHSHLGTQGDGNHFLFIGKSLKTGDTILVTHHGSRGFGAELYDKGMKCAETFRKSISPNTHKYNAWIPADTTEGKSYWEALQIVREWTKLNHTLIHDAIANKLNITPVQRFWNEHNFVFKDGDLYYHAKGSTPMRSIFMSDSDGLKLIPLNMGQPVLVVSEVESENNLGFAPHGAGRNMSRKKHICSKGGKSVDDIMEDEVKGLDIRFYTGRPDISELPSAYKNADEIKKQIVKYNLAKIEDEILPYGCIMAGESNYFHKRK